MATLPSKRPKCLPIIDKSQENVGLTDIKGMTSGNKHQLIKTATMTFMMSTIAIVFMTTGCSDTLFRGPSKTKKKPITIEGNPIDHAVFAVRDLGCAMCHANVESNIITDMMAGSDAKTEHQAIESWIFLFQNEKDKDANQANPSNQMAPLNIQGSIIIPKVSVQHDGAVEMTPNSWDQTLRCKTSVHHAAFEMSSAAKPVSIKSVMDQCATPHIIWGSGSNKFEERDQVEIDPPNSASEIASIAAKSGVAMTTGGITKLPSFDPTGTDANLRPVASHTGFSVVNGAVKITGDATCEGALLIDAPVYFENVSLSTAKGCRIYSMASIFIKGKLDVLNAGKSGPKADVAALMLMSPTFVGLHIPFTAIKARLNHGINRTKTFRAGSSAAILSRIQSDATKAGFPVFTPEETDGEGAAVSYSRIVATAPVIYSRMKGRFSGAVIAEHFMGKVGSLSFKFDPVLENAPFYPELIHGVRAGKNIVSTGDKAAQQ